jgi:ArsR family transcriptional regulator
MTEMEAIALFKCLADKSRLQILKSLLQEDMYVERLAQRLGISPPTVSFHLKKLLDAGAVHAYKDQYYTMYAIRREVFERSMLDVIGEESDEADAQAMREAAYRRKVIDAFFEYGRLKSIPVQEKKERIVLEKIARVFEEGKTYTEREVNVILADFHDDFCTLRRELVAQGLMERDRAEYRKTNPHAAGGAP